MVTVNYLLTLVVAAALVIVYYLLITELLLIPMQLFCIRYFHCECCIGCHYHQSVLMRSYTVTQKNCAVLFLSELCQISRNFNNYW